jgi:hypothetical protein
VARFCVFCGKNPEGKSLEHVLPQWLIGLTGEPTRIGRFGLKLEGPSEEERLFSFSAFKFPACESCNTAFSGLEAAAKGVFTKILGKAEVSSAEFSTLLDWLDKVRIGLWLAFMYLDKNPVAIKPHFYMTHRVGMHDRMLLLFRTNGDDKGLNTAGTNTGFFRRTPSCFLLRVNSYVFVSLSYPFLLSRRIGFPYPIECFMTEDQQLDCNMAPARGRVMMPLLRKTFGLDGTELYQPMFNNLDQAEEERRYWDVPYVRENSLSWDKGVGKIFMSVGQKLTQYPDAPSKSWLPVRSYRSDVLLREAWVLTVELQNYLISIPPSLDRLSKNNKAKWKRTWLLCKRQNDTFIQNMRTRSTELETVPPLWT